MEERFRWGMSKSLNKCRGNPKALPTIGQIKLCSLEPLRTKFILLRNKRKDTTTFTNLFENIK